MKFIKYLVVTVFMVTICLNSSLLSADVFIQQEFSKIEVLDKETKVFHYLKGPKGQKVTENTLSFSIKIRNGTDGIISKIDFGILLRTPGMPEPWLSGTFTEELTGGLKPGDKKSCYISTNRLVEKDWKEKYSSISTLDVIVSMLYGANGQPLSSQNAIIENHKTKSIGFNVFVDMTKKYSTIIFIAIPVIILPIAAWIIIFLPKQTRDTALYFFFSGTGLFMFLAFAIFPNTPHIGGMLLGLLGFILFFWFGYKDVKDKRAASS